MDSPYIRATHNLKLRVAQRSRNRTNYIASPAKKNGNGLVMCCACHRRHYYEVSSGDPWWPQGERQTERNMEEDSGERDEGEQLYMGSPGTTSTWHKPAANSGRGLMCFETRRGLSKYKPCFLESDLRGLTWWNSCCFFTWCCSAFLRCYHEEKRLAKLTFHNRHEKT